MSKSIHRREFLKGAAAGVGFWVASQYVRGDEGAESPSPNERLNIAFVGTANRAGDNINDIVATNMANIVALCDVDDRFLGAAAARFPKAKTYNDYRKMLERKDIDCVLTATADHVHAWATLAALRSGRHAYCEKPLTHSVEECRLVTETAVREKRVTQMGTQIHAGENYRRVVELIQANAIGPVNEVHVFIDKTWFPDKPARLGDPVPSYLHWDLWLGPTPDRPYSPDYLPATWRRWWAFGEGTLGDMGCHYQDLAFWALGLTAPTKIDAEGPPVDKEGCPEWLTVHYDYPARGEQPPVKLTWYDGPHNPPPVLKDLGLTRWKNGVLFLGSKGQLIADYDKHELLPKDKFKDFQRPPKTIPPSLGHHKEWLTACKKNDPSATTCRFPYSGPLTEAVLLGTVAYRVGKPIEWDAKNIKVTNVPEAEQYIRLKYREGWKLEGS